MRDWIFEHNLRAWLEIVARALGSDFDSDDWDAVRFGIKVTNVENDSWYDYPLGAAHVRVALDPGSSVIAVAVDGADQLTDQIAMVTSIAQTYTVTRTW